MPDILSTIEKTLAEEADPLLKNKKKHKKQKKTERGDRQFDDLEEFKSFLKLESLSDYDEKVHAKLKYYPPFVMSSCHNDPEKIKPSMNKNNKKFVRHLSQHVNKHLIHDIEENSDFLEKMDMAANQEETTFDKLVWHYVDRKTHRSASGNKFRVEMDVECHNDDASVSVDYRAFPVFED